MSVTAAAQQPECSVAVHPCRGHCENCPYGGPKVGAKGPIDAALVVAAESPGTQEVRKGYPLAGPSGDVVHMFIPEDSAYFLNAMECSPRKKKKGSDLNATAARACHDRLIEDVTQYPRRLIIAMGNAAVWSLTGDYNLKITQIRGQLLNSEYAELGILPVLHPAALLRGTGSFRQWREDIAYGMDLFYGRDVARYEPPSTIDVAARNRPAFLEAIKDLERYPILAGDIETGSLRIWDDDAEVLDIGVEGLTQEYKPTGRVYRFDPCWLYHGKLRELILDPDKRWIWHNGKFDCAYLDEQYQLRARVDEDTMLLSYARDEQPGVHDLDTVGKDVLNAPDHKDMLKPYLPNKKTSYRVIPQDVRTEYLGYDVSKTSQIFAALRPRIADDPALEKLYTKTLLPASKMLQAVERRGIYVDMDVVAANDEAYQRDLVKSLERIHNIVGRDVNPNSPQQMQEVLFKQFKLPNRAKGSTAKEVLEKMPQVPIVKALLGHRKLAKAYGTYVKSIYKHRREDGRVHPTYLIHGTRTGRLSSREPNMQNQPRDPVIRGQFCAPPGFKLLEVDLAQAELRVLAVLSGDPDLLHIFRTGVDLHDDVARFIFKIPDNQEVTKEQRVLAKTINFGIIYGRTGFTIAQEFGMTVAQGNAYVAAWFERFPVAAKFIARCRNCPALLQTITTCFGRKKRPGLVTRENIKELQNEAANFPEQSIASDITLHAAIRLFEELPRLFGAYIVNLIHDAILMEVPDNTQIIQDCARLVGDTLTQVPIDWGLSAIPFQSDAELGTHWGRLEKMT